jgi:hypothetical protein
MHPHRIIPEARADPPRPPAIRRRRFGVARDVRSRYHSNSEFTAAARTPERKASGASSGLYFARPIVTIVSNSPVQLGRLRE